MCVNILASKLSSASIVRFRVLRISVLFVFIWNSSTPSVFSNAELSSMTAEENYVMTSDK